MASTKGTIIQALAILCDISTAAQDALTESNCSPALSRVIELRAEEVGDAQAAQELAVSTILAAYERHKPEGVSLEPQTDSDTSTRCKASRKTIKRMLHRIKYAS